MSQTETTADPWTEYEKTLAAANTANKTAVFEALAAAGITSVVITFNGEGDSGQMEDVVALIGEKPHKLPDLPVQFRHAAYGKPESEIRPMPLAEAIETLCYDYLSQEHGGWENNDGGSGDFTFRVADRAIDLEFSARYTDTTNYSFEGGNHGTSIPPLPLQCEEMGRHRRRLPGHPGYLMPDHDRLSSLILEHWSRYHPKMLTELRQQDRLQQTLDETADRFADLLYDLVSVKKMEYHQAWEIVIGQILLPEESPLS